MGGKYYERVYGRQSNGTTTFSIIEAIHLDNAVCNREILISGAGKLAVPVWET